MKKNYLLVLLLVTCEYVLSQDLTNLKSKAESGDNNAQYELACEYLNTNTPNYIEVLNLLRKSAKSGNFKAKQLLSELSAPGHDGWGDTYLLPQYDDGVLSEENLKIVEQYATKGCSSSTCKGHKGYLLILAHSYYHEKKYEKAVYYYKMALSQMKQGNLGKYSNGEDFGLYMAWLDAYSMLGYCYEHGYGVEKDLKTAMDYYLIGGIYIDEGKYDISGMKRIVKEINNPELTKECLGEDGENTNGLQFYDGLVPSPFAIRSWDKPGAICVKLGKFDLAKEFLCEDFGFSNGAIRDLWVGEMFYKGYGRPQNYPKAYEYFNYIVNEMEGPWSTEVYEYYPDIYADACYRLYECYAYGRGVEKDAPKAEKYFKLALKFGSSSAIYDDQKRYEITEQ